MFGDIGNAFLTVVPKMGKNAEATIQNDLKSVDMGGVGTSWAASIGKKFIGAFDAMELGRLLGDVLADAFNNYADYQQLVGGVETLFKHSADVVKAYAAEAYRTAGMSANQYMEVATSFSATLIKSLGGDTEAAANLVDMAITDMSDNANKMGTDLDMLMNAYMSMSRGSAAMLDNLKIGYGGTQKELLKLAKETGVVSEDIQSFADLEFSDVILAIHRMQEELGITGTTAKEAASTISGSFNQLEASWDNFLTAMGDPDADMDAAIEQLVDSLGVAIENAAPVLARLGIKFVTAIRDGVPIALAKLLTEDLPVWFDEAIAAAEEQLNRFWDIGYNIITGIIDGFMSRVYEFISMVGDTVDLAATNAASVAEIASPSKRFRRMGRYMVEGLMLGIEDEAPNAVSAMASVMGMDGRYTATITATGGVVGAINALHADLGKIISDYSPNGIDATRSYLGELQRKAAMIA